MTMTAFAQKREVRNATRYVASEKYQEALNELESVESLISNEKDNLKAEFYYLKSVALFNTANNDVSKIEKAIQTLDQAKNFKGSTATTSGISSFTSTMAENLVTTAIEDQSAGNNLLAADKLVQAYKINPQDTTYLYYAASNYHGGEDYDRALKHYNELIELGYTGIATQYFAVDKATGEKHLFNDTSQRDLMMKTGQYEDPTEEVTEDISPQILQYMAYIYIHNEDFENAIKTVDNALVGDPDNTALLRAKADVVYQLGDKEQYKEIMQQIVTLDPTNAELFFNLGVGSTELGEVDEALTFYDKAIALKDDYYAAYLNAAVLLLNKDDAFVQEMNQLGMSSADMKKYEELQNQRKDLFKQTIPYLEKAIEINSTDSELIKTLANVYMQLGDDEKADSLMKQIED